MNISDKDSYLHMTILTTLGLGRRFVGVCGASLAGAVSKTKQVTPPGTPSINGKGFVSVTVSLTTVWK